jgi:hypothetical protein
VNRYRKAIIAVVGWAVTLAGYHLLPGEYNDWVVALIPLLTALGVYQVRNVHNTSDTYSGSTGTPAV